MFLPLVQVSQAFPPLASQVQETYICVWVLHAASVGQVMVSATDVETVVAGMLKFHQVGAVLFELGAVPTALHPSWFVTKLVPREERVEASAASTVATLRSVAISVPE